MFSPTASRSSSRSTSGMNRVRVSSTASLKSHSSDFRDGGDQDTNECERTGTPFLLDSHSFVSWSPPSLKSLE